MYGSRSLSSPRLLLTREVVVRQCGAIREVKSKVINDRAVATVEFVNRVRAGIMVTKCRSNIHIQCL